MTGRAKRLARTIIAESQAMRSGVAPLKRRIGARSQAERERLGDLDDPQEQDDADEQDRVDRGLEDEPPQPAPRRGPTGSGPAPGRDRASAAVIVG